MGRTTITIPDDVRKRLRLMAAERGVSMATVIREALEEKAVRQRPKLKTLGIASSGYLDTSELAGELTPEPPPWRSS